LEAHGLGIYGHAIAKVQAVRQIVLM